MPYLYLISGVFCSASASIFASLYNRKNVDRKNATSLYRVLLTCSVFAFWLVTFLTERSADAGVWWYAVLFGVFYAFSIFGLFNALRTGPIILTSLILHLSLIGVTAWGFFFWDTKFTLLVGIGLVLVVIALWLCLYTGKATEKKQISLKWIGFSALAFICNAGCVIVQKTQQMDFDGQYGNLTMAIASGIAMLICLGGFFCGDRSDARVILKGSWYIPVMAGIGNGAMNLFTILMATSTLSPSLIYPVLAIGGIAVTTVASVLVFKEKMRWWQWIGVFIGTVATGILSI